jgi:hypothetical protein
MTIDRAALGKANRRRGAVAERALVTWLRENGFPQAERAVRTGYRVSGRESADLGDVTGMPGIVVQVTDRDDLDQDAVLTRRLSDTERQRAAANADVGLLVQRRRGTTNPSRWWVWLQVADLIALTPAAIQVAIPELHVPARLELRHVAVLLIRAGYGTTPTVQTA